MLKQDVREHQELPEWLENLPGLVRRLLKRGHRPERVEHQFRERFSAYLTAIVRAWTAVLAGEQREAWIRGETSSIEPPWVEEPQGLKQSLGEIQDQLAAIGKQLATIKRQTAPKRPGPRQVSQRRSPK